MVAVTSSCDFFNLAALWVPVIDVSAISVMVVLELEGTLVSVGL